MSSSFESLIGHAPQPRRPGGAPGARGGRPFNGPMSSSFESLIGQAAQLRRAGRTLEALAAYETLLAAHPNLPDSWYNLALLQRKAGRPEAALASYDQALRRGVSDPEEVRVHRPGI